MSEKQKKQRSLEVSQLFLSETVAFRFMNSAFEEGVIY